MMVKPQYVDTLVFVENYEAKKLTEEIIDIIEGEECETLSKMKYALIEILMGKWAFLPLSIGINIKYPQEKEMEKWVI